MSDNRIDVSVPDLEGGWVPSGGRKWHFCMNIDGGRLCGRWLILLPKEEYEHREDDSPDNCAECKKRLAKARAKLVSIMSQNVEGEK